MKNIKLYIMLLAIAFTVSSSICVQKQKSTEKLKLLYVYDPLCGWCYGFGPVVEKIEKNFKGTAEVDYQWWYDNGRPDCTDREYVGIYLRCDSPAAANDGR